MELSGPPDVVTITSLNTWKAPEMTTMISRVVISRTSGIETLKNRGTGPTPSMFAASYSSVGMRCSATEKSRAL